MRAAPAILCLGLVCSIGCEDPAALEVIVAIEEDQLLDLVVRVGRGEDSLVDCTLAFEAEPTGTCPFEKGAGLWLDPARYSFILYGDPRTEVVVEIDGRRNFGGALAVVTTTAAVAELPPNPGERAVLELPLIDRTSERLRCATEIATEEVNGLTDQASLVLFGGGAPWFAYTAVANELSRVRYRRSDDACTLEAQPLMRREEQLPCRVRARSLVGKTLDDGVVMLAGMCTGPGATRLVSALVGPDPLAMRTETRTLPLSGSETVNQGRVSQPVLADLDGDGTPEVASVFAVARTVHLLIWRPFTNTATTVTLEKITMTQEPDEIPPGPIVVPTRRVDTTPNERERFDVLVIAGYGGGMGVASGSPAGPTFALLVDDNGAEASRRGPSLAILPDPILVDVRASEVRFTELRFPNTTGAPFALGSTRSSPLLGGADRRLDARVAIGRLADGEGLSAIFTEDGFVEVHPLSGTGAFGFDAWNGAIDAAQHNLLWNMDGRPGAEIVSFDTGDEKLFAHTADGRPLDGWNPLSGSQSSEDITVALATLGGGTDFDLDVVILAGRSLEVITLGQGSVPRTEFGWHAPSYDASGSAAWRVGENASAGDAQR